MSEIPCGVDKCDDRHCARCGTDLHMSHMSWFEPVMVCLDCYKIEAKCPGYANARKVEMEHTLRGDTNFPGVGLSNEDREYINQMLSGVQLG